ncbi:hypothetical protein BRDID11002_26050 [Bradyrhizobium diazoefficiens]|jgi:hypothetical protein|uniref:Uncharacterized protein n=1 Tax=Bradyrhizobium diazoefficiens SEMIA 5080 TaxID=754504 RepID=A0A837CBE2_9BRAD|nr:hypothetical protein BJA5080_02691 [Bradyrhizobium diazoefficiens SEMIA 5080]GEC47287.1 hypothetical protein BJA01nite_49290 [Bradyrhizobium japonicum]
MLLQFKRCDFRGAAFRPRQVRAVTNVQPTSGACAPAPRAGPADTPLVKGCLYQTPAEAKELDVLSWRWPQVLSNTVDPAGQDGRDELNSWTSTAS